MVEEASNPYLSRIEEPSAKALFFYSLARLHMADRRWEEADDALSKALAFDARDPELFVAHGEVLAQLGKTEAAMEALKKALKVDSDFQAAHILLGQLYGRMGKNDQAAFHLRKALERDPGNQKVAIQLAMVYANTGNLEASAEVLETYLEGQPDSLAVNYTLARVRRQQGDAAEAERLYRRAIELQPRLQPAVLELSQFLAEQNRAPEALVVLREAAEANPGDLTYSHQVVQLLLQANRVVEAQAELEAILAQNPEDKEARRKLGVILLDQQSWSHAEKIFSRLVAESEGDSNAYYLGIALEKQDRPEEALTAYEKVGQDSNLYPDAVAHRSYLLRRVGRVGEAITLLNEALESGVDRVEFYLYLASLLRQLKDPTAAIQVLEKGRQVFPGNTRFPYQKGVIQDEIGRKDLAEETMKGVLRMDPNHADALNYLAYLWAEQNRNLEQALEYIQRALERKRPGYMIDTLGWVYFKLGRLDEARQELENAVALLAEDMLVLEHLADVYAASGMIEQAIKAYSTILNKNPDNSAVAEKLKALQGGR